MVNVHVLEIGRERQGWPCTGSVLCTSNKPISCRHKAGLYFSTLKFPTTGELATLCELPLQSLLTPLHCNKWSTATSVGWGNFKTNDETTRKKSALRKVECWPWSVRSRYCGSWGKEMSLANVFACIKLSKSDVNHHIAEKVKIYHLS